MLPYYPREVDYPARWKRCPQCGDRAAGVRKDLLTDLRQCDACWFGTNPADHGHTKENGR